MAEHVREILGCENCHAEMQPLGKLTAIGAKPQSMCSGATGAIAFKQTRSKTTSVGARQVTVDHPDPHV